MRSIVLRAPSARSSRLLAGAAALVLVVSGIAVPIAVAHDPAAGTAAVTITIRSGLSDRDVRIGVGDIVRFENRDSDRHRMRSRSGPRGFDTGNLEPGESYQVRLTVAGTYSYLDERNDDASAYRGRIVVGSGGTGGPGSGGSTTAGGGGAPAGGGSVPASATVTMGDDFYQPTSIRIAVGGSVTFRNGGGDEHSATSTAFDTGAMAGGTSVRKSFSTAGSFDFLCIFHSDMRGTVKVVTAGAATSVPLPAAPRANPAPVATPTPAPAAAVLAPTREPAASAQPAAASQPAGPSGEPAPSVRASSAATSDITSLAGIALAVTLVSVAAAMFARVLRGTVRDPE